MKPKKIPPIARFNLSVGKTPNTIVDEYGNVICHTCDSFLPEHGPGPIATMFATTNKLYMACVNMLRVTGGSDNAFGETARVLEMMEEAVDLATQHPENGEE